MGYDALKEIENEASSGTRYSFWSYSKDLESDYNPYDPGIDTTLTLPTYDPKMVLVTVHPTDHDILYKLPTIERLAYDNLRLSLYSNTAHLYSTSGSFRYATVYLYIWY